VILLAYIIFILCGFLILYNYLFYPLILSVLARKVQSNDIFYKLEDDLPFISILLAVYNEEAVIKEKIKSTFKTNYPLDKIEFLIGSDASSDNTEQIIKSLQSDYPQIKLTRFGGRTGKPQIINKLEELSTGSILILTDANVFFKEDTLFELVKHYKNRDIGLVGGNIINNNVKFDGISNQEKTYLAKETILKFWEGKVWGSMMGAFGGLYSVRKKNYSPVPDKFIVDDFFITMNVIRSGSKAINELDAQAYEDVSNISSEEFRRKIRISTGNFQNLNYFKSLIWSRFSISFPLISHKILRWQGPFFLFLIAISSIYLAFKVNLFVWISTFILIILLSPIWDFVLKKMNINNKLLRFVSHFVSMNVALIIGFFNFTFGNITSTWNPTQRNQ